MKTTIKQIATGTLIVLLLIAIDANAHRGKAKASGHENYYEPALVIEDWMISESAFDFSPSEELAIEQENELKVESWMTDTYELYAGSAFKNEAEEVLSLEKWMIQDNSSAYNSEVEETETELKVENWMTK